ncbi:MAG: TetR/AcrR family transcriptional regulator [Phaeodactylibacter sp.]|nr:TetR/AcrR family transcriptional regulator [Phaeodactylibacter sp.]
MSNKKSTHSREGILQATLELIARQGKEQYSVRNVARQLGASTQPIYSYFKDSTELYKSALLAIEQRLLAQIVHPYTEYPFRNMGYGFTLFAKENPRLFEAFFSDIEMNRRFINKFLVKLRAILDTDPRFREMSSPKKDSLLNTMWTFSYGYAFLIIRGLVPDDSDEAIKAMVLETGTAVIQYHFQS